MSKLRPCAKVKDNGEKCGAKAQADSEWCLFHNPKNEEAAKEWKSRGGQSRQTGVDDDGPRSILKIVRRTIRAVRDNRLEAKQGSAIASLCGVALKALAQLDTDPRLQELERKTAVLEGLTREQLLRLAQGGDESPESPATN